MANTSAMARAYIDELFQHYSKAPISFKVGASNPELVHRRTVAEMSRAQRQEVFKAILQQFDTFEDIPPLPTDDLDFQRRGLLQAALCAELGSLLPLVEGTNPTLLESYFEWFVARFPHAIDVGPLESTALQLLLARGRSGSAGPSLAALRWLDVLRTYYRYEPSDRSSLALDLGVALAKVGSPTAPNLPQATGNARLSAYLRRTEIKNPRTSLVPLFCKSIQVDRGLSQRLTLRFECPRADFSSVVEQLNTIAKEGDGFSRRHVSHPNAFGSKERARSLLNTGSHALPVVAAALAALMRTVVRRTLIEQTEFGDVPQALHHILGSMLALTRPLSAQHFAQTCDELSRIEHERSYCFWRDPAATFVRTHREYLGRGNDDIDLSAFRLREWLDRGTLSTWRQPLLSIDECLGLPNEVPLAWGQPWADLFVRDASAFGERTRRWWASVCDHAIETPAKRISEAWTNELRKRVLTRTPRNAARTLHAWLDAVCVAAPPLAGGPIGGRDSAIPGHESTPLLRGLVFVATFLHTSELIRCLAELAKRSYHKVQWLGPRAPMIGEAAILALGRIENADARRALQGLKSSIDVVPAQRLIELQLIGARAPVAKKKQKTADARSRNAKRPRTRSLQSRRKTN